MEKTQTVIITLSDGRKGAFVGKALVFPDEQEGRVFVQEVAWTVPVAKLEETSDKSSEKKPILPLPLPAPASQPPPPEGKTAKPR